MKTRKAVSVVQPTDFEGPQEIRRVRAMRFDQSSFLTDCVNRYVQLAGGNAPANLTYTNTPGRILTTQNNDDKYPEDIREAIKILNLTMDRARWLGIIPRNPAKVGAYETDETQGKLGKIAARVLMKILYAARHSRPDLMRVTTYLASKVNKWTPGCDVDLHKLMCYIVSTMHFCQIGYIGDDDCDLEISCYGDADFSGDKTDCKSTTGAFICISGKFTRFPIGALSRKHNVVSHSTTEAEIVAFSHAIRMEGIPTLDIMEHVLAPADPPLVFYEDNNATIRIIEMGKSPNLRHIKRMHDISLEWYHDCVRDGIFTIKYCPTHLQVADMMTKTTHDPSTWRSLLRLACLYPGTTPPPIPESYDGTGTTGRGDMIDDQGNIINVSKKVKRIRATPTHYN